MMVCLCGFSRTPVRVSARRWRCRSGISTLRRARISRTWSNDETGRAVLGTPKNSKARTIAVPGFLVDGLAGLCDGHGDGDYVFRAARGGPVNLNNWRNRVWYPTVRGLGMEDEDVTIHSLRHTYASFAIAQGADVKTLQMQLGHFQGFRSG